MDRACLVPEGPPNSPAHPAIHLPLTHCSFPSPQMLEADWDCRQKSQIQHQLEASVSLYPGQIPSHP